MAHITTTEDFKLYWTAGGTHTIAPGRYTPDQNLVNSAPLSLTPLGLVEIDMSDLYDLSINSANPVIQGADNNSRITFRRGATNSLTIRAASGGVTGLFRYCSFSESRDSTGLNIVGTAAGAVNILCEWCIAEDNATDGFGIETDADGAEITLTLRKCAGLGQNLMDAADFATAHRANHHLVIEDCYADDCTNAVRVANAGAPLQSPSITIDGLYVNNCKRGVSSLTGNSPCEMDISRMSYINPKANGVAIENMSGSLVVRRSYLIGSEASEYGIFTQAAMTSVTIEDTVIAHFLGAGAALWLNCEGDSYSTTVEGCTFDMNQCHCFISSLYVIRNSILMRAQSATNGAVFSGGGDKYRLGGSGNNIFYGNALNFQRGGDELAASDIEGDPGLMAPDSYDYRVATNSSACYGAGAARTGPVLDWLGSTRKAAPDIGGLELIEVLEAADTFAMPGAAVTMRPLFLPTAPTP